MEGGDQSVKRRFAHTQGAPTRNKEKRQENTFIDEENFIVREEPGSRFHSVGVGWGSGREESSLFLMPLNKDNVIWIT